MSLLHYKIIIIIIIFGGGGGGRGGLYILSVAISKALTPQNPFLCGPLWP